MSLTKDQASDLQRLHQACIESVLDLNRAKRIDDQTKANYLNYLHTLQQEKP